MPIYCAWVSSFTTTFNTTTHKVIDPNVLSVEITHSEGEFAAARLAYLNPGVGLLNPSRNKVALISWADGTGTPTLIFRGRIIGFPLGLNGAEIAIQLSAEPPDAETQLATLAGTLDDAPWYEPLFADPLADLDPADTIEARPVAWYWSATAGTVTTSNLIEGGAGTIDLGGDYAADSFTIDVGDPPLTRVDVTVTVEWEQRCQTSCNIGGQVAQRLNGSVPIWTYTPGEFAANWPSVGSSFSGGWTVTRAKLTEVDSKSSGFLTVRRYKLQDGEGGSYRTYTVQNSIVLVGLYPELVVSCDYRQSRREILKVSVGMAQQAVFGSDARVEKIDLTADDITIDRTTPAWEKNTAYEEGDYVIARGRRWSCAQDHTSGDYFIEVEFSISDDPTYQNRLWNAEDETMAPLGRAFRSHFLDQANVNAVEARAKQVISHAVLRGRALLLSRLRCVEVGVTGLWETLASLTLDHNITVENPQFTDPITGKVISYTKRWNVPDGERGVDVTIACCPGTGASQPTPPSDVEAWADNFTEDFTQRHYLNPTTGVVIIMDPAPPLKEPVAAESLGTDSYVVTSVTRQNKPSAQKAYVQAAAAAAVSTETSPNGEDFDLLQALEDVPTGLIIRLRNIGSWDTLERTLTATVTDLVAPRQIQLEG